MTDGSRYICGETFWNPIAGPPARSSTSTPVSLPCETSGPVTRLRAVSTLAPGPSRWYTAAWLTSGHQLTCTTTLSGQVPRRSSGPPLAAATAPPAAAGARGPGAAPGQAERRRDEHGRHGRRVPVHASSLRRYVERAMEHGDAGREENVDEREPRSARRPGARLASHRAWGQLLPTADNVGR